MGVLAVAFVILFLSAAVSGCGGQEGSTATETSDSTQEVGTQASERRPTVQSIQNTISRIRGLPVKNETIVSYLSREELKEELRTELEEDYPLEMIRADEKALRALGLLGEDESLAEGAMELLGEGVAGFYDDETKELKIVSENEYISPVNEMTLSHEITHALQDQHFGLRALLGGDSGNGDRDLAVMSLIEGDATLVEREYTYRVMSLTDQATAALGAMGALEGMGPVPSYLRETLEFPYLSGSRFVSHLLEFGGWESVNAAYGHPPESTEQVLHPEKYFLDEGPVPVQIPDLTTVIGESWAAGRDEVIGEFDVAELLEVRLPHAAAALAAEGWGGGAFRYYTRETDQMLVLKLAWDTQADAGEFASAMGESLKMRYSAEFDLGAPVPLMVTPDGAWALVEHGGLVVSVLSPDAGTSSAVAGAIAGI